MNDSHSGTFSSYSLNVMLIFYLQRCKPTPLLPFLQEVFLSIYFKTKKIQISTSFIEKIKEAIIDGVVPKEVDGWSVAFSQNVDRIVRIFLLNSLFSINSSFFRKLIGHIIPKVSVNCSADFSHSFQIWNVSTRQLMSYRFARVNAVTRPGAFRSLLKIPSIWTTI